MRVMVLHRDDRQAALRGKIQGELCAEKIGMQIVRDPFGLNIKFFAQPRHGLFQHLTCL
jgi:hypothetical protein